MLTQTLCNEMQSDPCKSRLGVMSSHILEPTALRCGAAAVQRRRGRSEQRATRRGSRIRCLLPFEDRGCGSSAPNKARNADDIQTNMATFLTFELLVSAMS